MGRSIHAIHPSLSWTSWASANSDLWDHVLQTFMRFLDYCIYQMLDSFHLVETWGKMYSANRWVYWIGSVMRLFIFPLCAISSTKCFKWYILVFWWCVKDLKSSTLESKLFTCFCSGSFSTLSCAHLSSMVRGFWILLSSCSLSCTTVLHHLLSSSIVKLFLVQTFFFLLLLVIKLWC